MPSVFRVTTVYSFLGVFSSIGTDIALKGVGLCTVASGQPVLAKEIVLSVVPGTPHEHLLQHSFRVPKDIQGVKGETTAEHRVLYGDTHFSACHKLHFCTILSERGQYTTYREQGSSAKCCTHII